MKNSALVTLTHRKYQALLRRQRLIPLATLNAGEKRDLERARREMASGDFISLTDLEHELGSTSRWPRA